MKKNIKKLISNNISKEKAYSIILRPIVTEKATLLTENNQIVFKVSLGSSKIEIKKSIELIFGVVVKAVNTIVTKGKTKTFKGRLGQRSNFKKAIVTLEEGHSIDLSLGA